MSLASKSAAAFTITKTGAGSIILRSSHILGNYQECFLKMVLLNLKHDFIKNMMKEVLGFQKNALFGYCVTLRIIIIALEGNKFQPNPESSIKHFIDCCFFLNMKS